MSPFISDSSLFIQESSPDCNTSDRVLKCLSLDEARHHAKKRCTIYACHFHTGDDAAAIKSGITTEGNAVNHPTRRIRIFDCASHFGHGITIGSEMSGGAEAVRIQIQSFEGQIGIPVGAVFYPLLPFVVGLTLAFAEVL